LLEIKGRKFLMEEEYFLHRDFRDFPVAEGVRSFVVAETIAEYALKFPAASVALTR
jgi:hypothetical protein